MTKKRQVYRSHVSPALTHSNIKEVADLFGFILELNTTQYLRFSGKLTLIYVVVSLSSKSLLSSRSKTTVG